MSHIYNNWKKDPADARDHLFVGAPVAVPDSVDLSPQCSPIEDQGQLGSCTGNAIVGVMEYLIRVKKDTTDLSRLFVYYNERVIEGTISEDAGAIIRDGIKTLASLGVCPEKSCKYDVAKFMKKPTATAYKAALKRKISSYQRLSTLDNMLACLASGAPFVFGFTVFESFESDATAHTGLMTMPFPREKNLGGHAVCAVGYDKTKQLVKVRNSWGAGWGDAGHFYMPFEYINNAHLADDFWTMKL